MLRDSRDVAIGGEVVDEIRVVTGSYISCTQIPKVSDAADNFWESTSAASANISVLSVYSGGSWIPLTISGTLPVTTSQYYLDAVTNQYSNRIYVHADYEGCDVHITYIGLGSLIEASTINTIISTITNSLPGRHLYPYSTSSYSNGAFDDSIADTTQIYLTASQNPIVSGGVFYSRNGAFLEFGAGGDCEVAAFTNATYWKRITVSLRAGVITTHESDEYAFQEDLPDYIDTSGYTIFYVDVQNNGTTGVTGAIVDIQQSVIQYIDIAQQTTVLVPLWLKNFGALEDGGLFDSVVAPGKSGEIDSFVFSCEDTPGDSGTTILNIYAHTPGDDVGVSIFDAPANQPTIAVSGGSYQIDITPAADFDQTQLTFGATTSFRVINEQIAVNPVNYSAILWLKLNG
jgi:hypothetical protein